MNYIYNFIFYISCSQTSTICMINTIILPDIRIKINNTVNINCRLVFELPTIIPNPYGYKSTGRVLFPKKLVRESSNHIKLLGPGSAPR